MKVVGTVRNGVVVPPDGTSLPEGVEVTVEVPDEGLSLEAVERAVIEAAIAKANGNQSAAARLLGVSRDTLRYRMEKFGLGE